MYASKDWVDCLKDVESSRERLISPTIEESRGIRVVVRHFVCKEFRSEGG